MKMRYQPAGIIGVKASGTLCSLGQQWVDVSRAKFMLRHVTSRTTEMQAQIAYRQGLVHVASYHASSVVYSPHHWSTHEKRALLFNA